MKLPSPHLGLTTGKKALQRFEQHAQSRIHKEAVLKIEMLKQPSIGAQLSSQVKKDQKI